MASVATVLANIFTSPAEAFPVIKERPRPWLPLFLLLFGACASAYVYLNSVDLPWFFDRQMQNAPDGVTEEQRAQAVELQASVSPRVLGAVGALSSAVGFLAVLALIALYYTVISFATNAGIKFKQWFAFIAWCSVPAVLGMLATLVNLVANDARFMPQEAINPLAFGALFAVDGAGLPVSQRILLSLDVTTMWGTVLQVLGYQAWTGRSLTVAASVVLGPLAVIVLLGALA